MTTQVLLFTNQPAACIVGTTSKAPPHWQVCVPQLKNRQKCLSHEPAGFFWIKQQVGLTVLKSDTLWVKCRPNVAKRHSRRW